MNGFFDDLVTSWRELKEMGLRKEFHKIVIMLVGTAYFGLMRMWWFLIPYIALNLIWAVFALSKVYLQGGNETLDRVHSALRANKDDIR